MNTTDKLAFLALGVSILTAIFSWYSFSKTDELSKNAFNRNYRPYVSGTNFSALKDNLLVPHINTVMISILNAPALITSKKLTLIIRDEASDKVYYESPTFKDELVYPLDKNQYTMTIGDQILNNQTAKNIFPKKLIRKVRIEYQWISDSTLNYFFESEWIYNIEKNDWDILNQSAN